MTQDGSVASKMRLKAQIASKKSWSYTFSTQNGNILPKCSLHTPGEKLTSPPHSAARDYQHFVRTPPHTFLTPHKQLTAFQQLKQAPTNNTSRDDQGPRATAQSCKTWGCARHSLRPPLHHLVLLNTKQTAKTYTTAFLTREFAVRNPAACTRTAKTHTHTHTEPKHTHTQSLVHTIRA